MDSIYLDYNATTPLDPEVIGEMEKWMHQGFGNPSSSHAWGVEPRKAIERAREQVAMLLECEPDEVFFTSGGTEANNMALKGVAFFHKSMGNHIITSSIEHPAVMEVCHWLAQNGFRITWLPVDGQGLVNPEEVERNITPQTLMVSIMHSNNETGVLQPVENIGQRLAERGILFHTDAAQSAGKVSVSAKSLQAGLISLAGHKIYAPKGIGVLRVRRGVSIEKWMHGAGQESNRRAGTENVIHIAALGKACELAARSLHSEEKRLKSLRDGLYQQICSQVKEVRHNGPLDLCLPNALSISFRGVNSRLLLAELDTLGVSAGAACHSDRIEMSHVLKAMGVEPEWAMGTLRISLGRFTTPEEVIRAGEELSRAVMKMQSGQKDATVMSGEKIRLTRFSQGLGCDCKIRPRQLDEILKHLPLHPFENLLVDAQTRDDAAVYRISEEVALVSTLDFFTPLVDDPFTFGAVAAANALSDIWAMGARPLFALNIVAFPSSRLPLDVLSVILKGAASVAEEAGIPVAGGHTIDDPEPKFGWAVTGMVHPSKIIRNQGARPGDVIILTKPLGTGILSAALKKGRLDIQSEKVLIASLLTLNRVAAGRMLSYPVTACTDVTGFGLLGHLLEMCIPQALGADLFSDSIPLLPSVETLVREGYMPVGSIENWESAKAHVQLSPRLSDRKSVV